MLLLSLQKLLLMNGWQILRVSSFRLWMSLNNQMGKLLFFSTHSSLYWILPCMLFFPTRFNAFGSSHVYLCLIFVYIRSDLQNALGPVMSEFCRCIVDCVVTVFCGSELHFRHLHVVVVHVDLTGILGCRFSIDFKLSNANYNLKLCTDMIVGPLCWVG